MMKKCLAVFVMLLLCLDPLMAKMNPVQLLTPLESSEFRSLPDSAEIEKFLLQLTSISPKMKLLHLGTSAGGRPISALLVSNSPAFLQSGQHESGKLTVLLLGSQHGTEPSGCEALQKLALELAINKERASLLSDFNFMIIANANPDGRDNNSRFNAQNGNLNVDFTRLAYPETRIFINLLKNYQIDALLDLHESSTKKKILTLKEGFYVNAEAQYEIGNNPNINEKLQKFSSQVLLPQLLKTSEGYGLRSEHYRGEILQLNQPVSHGGLRVSNMRNYSALQGIFSVLVENRLDSKTGHYETPGNIKARRDKQYISVLSFLTVIEKNKQALQSIIQQARNEWKNYPINYRSYLAYHYSLNMQQPRAEVSLRRADNLQEVHRAFANFDFIEIDETILMPDAYLIKSSETGALELLKKHNIEVEKMNASKEVIAINPVVHSLSIHYSPIQDFFTSVKIDVDYDPQPLILTTGDYLVSTHQPQGKLIPLLLDLRSIDSVFQNLKFNPDLARIKKGGILPVKFVDDVFTPMH
ncbi:Zinc carboxypeptidase [Legionella birminghamensis]|uniref:Zinc carboxypeptidase n=1 Tax=Legionella birminghamensis TaxID=28083 RepID=A0A378I6D8_9GAMM|nr:M14 family zinc carboxypeptidase [Legionella birminghamensis]KTC68709.1 Zinc carboxypeptidase [Legionella birminghamensis]STX30305.1 Zinc carboxypeptidase [Legionella birminghamensis]